MTHRRKQRTGPKLRGGARLVLAAHRMGLGLTSRVAPGLARRWATHLFCKPPRHKHPKTEQPYLARGTRFNVDGPYGRVAAWRWGQGERRVLLVHGWGGRGTQLWPFIEPLCAAGFEVIAFDAPGHGYSPSRYATMLHFAKSMVAVSEAVGGVYGIVAHSLGAAAANLATSEGWLSVQRVVVMAAPIDVEGMSQAFARALNISEPVRAAMQAHMETRFSHRWQDLEGGRVAAQNRTPALIVHDRDDHDVPFAAAERLAAHWPQATLLATDKQGHRRILRDPAVVAQVVMFMTGHAESRRSQMSADGYAKASAALDPA